MNADLTHAKRLTLAGAAVNVFYCVLKIYFGHHGGSAALLADGLHALVDVGSDMVALASLSFATSFNRRRCSFPFGIGRAETVGALLIATVLTLGSISVAAAAVQKLRQRISPTEEKEEGKSSCGHDHHHHHDHQHSHECGHDHSGGPLSFLSHDHSFEIFQQDEKDAGRRRLVWSMLLIAASSIVCKELLYRTMMKAGKKIGSASVVANAYHHRADAACAVLGLVGAAAANSPSLWFLDVLGGLGVAAVVARIGLSTLRGSALTFFDYQSHDLTEIGRKARSVGALHEDEDEEAGAMQCNGQKRKKKVLGVLVNAFVTRHGLSYVLHGTLMMRHDASVDDVSRLELRVLQEIRLPNSQVYDVFFKVRPVEVSSATADEQGAETPEHKKSRRSTKNLQRLQAHRQVSEETAQQHERKQGVDGGEGAKNDDDDDLRLALLEVADFHSIRLEDRTVVDIDSVARTATFFVDGSTTAAAAGDGDAAALKDDCRTDLEHVLLLFNYVIKEKPRQTA